MNAEKLAAQAAELFTKGSANGVYPLDSFINKKSADQWISGLSGPPGLLAGDLHQPLDSIDSMAEYTSCLKKAKKASVLQLVGHYKMTSYSSHFKIRSRVQSAFSA